MRQFQNVFGQCIIIVIYDTSTHDLIETFESQNNGSSVLSKKSYIQEEFDQVIVYKLNMLRLFHSCCL